VKGRPDHASNLAPYEVNAVLDWFLYRMTADERVEMMHEFPAIYNKLVGQEIATVARRPHKEGA